MSKNVMHELLTSRFSDLVLRLEKAIGPCPDELWNRNTGGPAYWYLAYHALFFLDLHLSDSPKGFRPPKPFAVLGVDFTGKGYPEVYSKDELMTYLEHDKEKGMALISSLTEEQAGKPCGFPWLKLTIEELFNYNIDRVTDYVDQLNELLGKE